MSNRLDKSCLFASWELSRFTVNVDGLGTAVYLDTNNHKKGTQTILLIHGLDGSHDGMMPFGYALRNEFNLVLIDLPGHAASDLPKDQSIERIDSWAVKLLPALKEQGIVIDKVIAHSFGCRIAAKIFDKLSVPTIFLMPVPEVSKTYRRWARNVYRCRFLLSRIHNIPWYSAARGFSLCKDRSLTNWRLMGWLASRSRPSRAVINYHLLIAAKMDTYKLPDSPKASFVVSSHDSLPHLNFFKFRALYPNAKTQLSLGGHLAPIENPNDLIEDLRNASLL